MAHGTAVHRYVVAALAVGALALTTSLGMSAEWARWSTSDASALVAAGFKQDDGGSLMVMCSPKTNLVSIGLEEPRAHWETGASINVIVKPDEGTTLKPSTALVVDPTRLIIKNEATVDLFKMQHSKYFFSTTVGDFVRVFPTANFITVVDPILRACGNHF